MAKRANAVTDRAAAPARDLSATFSKEIAPDATVESIRFVFDQLAGLLNRRLPKVGAFHERVPLVAPDRTITADIIVPDGAGPFPVFVYCHGGAWVAGNPASHRKLTHRFAEGGVLVVSVDYRLAPEHPFPAAFDDCVFAVDWVFEHVREYGGDPARIAIGGDSAGGNLAAAVAIELAQRKRGPRVEAAVLIYGVFDFADVGGPLFSRVLHEAYLGANGAALLRDPRVSPVHGAHRLPPSLIIVGGQDPLIDDALALAQRLAAAGVRHEYVVAPGMPHGFVQMEFFGDARRSIERVQAFLARELAPTRRTQWRRRILDASVTLRRLFRRS
ncbi:MAG TPA: alpha/beta hydrolase [Pseudomonadales bacterium]|nr:alpha/beta hydrolase [Pseudomonadales bacterium]